MGVFNAFGCLLLTFTASLCQLVVNVRNTGGDVYRENIEANTTLDTILLEFRKSDGTLITQFIDGRNEVQIFRVVVLPEEELGQTAIQTFCIIQRFTKNEFISSDAMSKLRQKNPSTIRHPEESRPAETFSMDVLLNVAASHVLSGHIYNVCSEAGTATYARSADLQLLSQILNRDYAILQTITQPAPTTNLTSCTEIPGAASAPEFSQQCTCHYDVCVGWYPCGLKYCRGKDSAGRVVSYRCGIKTCSRCRRFEFRVGSKRLCVWDEPEFQLPDPDGDVAGNEEMEQLVDPEGLSPRRRAAVLLNAPLDVRVAPGGVGNVKPAAGLGGNWNNHGVVAPANGATLRYHDPNVRNDPKKHVLDDDED